MHCISLLCSLLLLLRPTIQPPTHPTHHDNRFWIKMSISPQLVTFWFRKWRQKRSSHRTNKINSKALRDHTSPAAAEKSNPSRKEQTPHTKLTIFTVVKGIRLYSNWIGHYFASQHLYAFLLHKTKVKKLNKFLLLQKSRRIHLSTVIILTAPASVSDLPSNYFLNMVHIR